MAFATSPMIPVNSFGRDHIRQVYAECTVRCEACGHENRAGARFCEACAAPLLDDRLSFETRKTVSIVFCDLAGSTALGESLDPEAVRRVMGRYFDAMRTTIHRHGGTVEKFIGDAVMAVFGVPRVHEDDALRAVRAAVDMRAALDILNEDLDRAQGIRLAARIGISTGEVVAGMGDQTFAIGDAVNVAARLEQAAAPGEILLGGNTLALVRDAVFVEEVGPLTLKGKRDPVAAFRLQEVAPRAEGFARHLDAPLVGRARELRTLADAFDRVVSDDSCHLITILGDAGIGKSRLMAAFVEGLDGRATVLRGRCLPYGDGITFYPLVEALIEAARLAEDDAPHAARAKLAALMGPWEEADRVADRVGDAIGIPGSGGAPEDTLWAIRMLLERLAITRPVVFVIDDLQWAERTFLDLVEHVANLTRDAPILVACMARPDLLEEHPGWTTEGPTATSIRLEPLGADGCMRLVANLLADDSIDASIAARIAEAAQGNPLYAEEITGFLVDGGRLVLDRGRWEGVGDVAEMPVPPTISALLAARLDQLAPMERRLVEIGSVIGQVFYTSAVEDLSDASRDRVEGGLRSLVRKQFVSAARSDQPGLEALGFRHLLIRDAAYDSMPKAARAELHQRFADWYAASTAAFGERDEILGYHLEQAYRFLEELGAVEDRARDVAQRAGEHLGHAGLSAFARGDYGAAAGLLGRALSLLPPVDPLAPRLQGRLARAFLESGDHAMAAEANARHLETARSISDRGQVFHAELAALELRVYRSPRDVTAEELEGVARPAAEVFKDSGDDEGFSIAQIFLSEAALRNGDVTEARRDAEIALDFGQRSGAHGVMDYAINRIAHVLFVGPAPASAALDLLTRLEREVADGSAASMEAQAARAWFLGYLGHFDEAQALARRLSDIHQELGNELSAIHMDAVLGRVDLMAGRSFAAEPRLRRRCDVLRTAEGGWFLGEALADLGDLLIRLGRAEEVLDITDSVRDLTGSDERREQARWRALRSVALARLGRVDEAMRLIDEAERSLRTTELTASVADTMLAKAEVMNLADRREAAISAAQEAVRLYEAKEFVPYIDWARTMLESLET